ncbi:cytochrome c oxidase subunit 4 isoform 2, mitochondrial isoform X1 [Choloepus didactylus]|uniref:cytochrome c oxidase subunit 4 isoform 2, mitochondrial isoform X1 n=1 Tax=Choloepus didactylus TaxID=27675 RepID=UPI00189E8C17|nr:cytochrome c oxidase subunit 4 isoform 2, mitochondrial isoform X1 [Choloepus didactylus]
MLSRATWSLALRKGGLEVRGTHSAGGTARSEGKMPPYTSYHAQRSYPMPDEPFCTELSAEQRALKEKEKGSWTQLSHAEKERPRLPGTKSWPGIPGVDAPEAPSLRPPASSVPAAVPRDLCRDEPSLQRVEDGDGLCLLLLWSLSSPDLVAAGLCPLPAVFPKKPITLTDEWKAKQLQRILDMKGNPVQGLASRWDYDKKEWKK